jgi:hypothetical protein
MFANDGAWLMTDSCDPLQSWNINEVLQSGKKHGVAPNDIYGALYFHLKDELTSFSRRMDHFNIEISVTCLDAMKLEDNIQHLGFPTFLKPGFDRIETSNLCDSVGISSVIERLGGLLNRRAADATLLVYTMNWPQKVPSAQAGRLLMKDRKADKLKEAALLTVSPPTY